MRVGALSYDPMECHYGFKAHTALIDRKPIEFTRAPDIGGFTVSRGVASRDDKRHSRNATDWRMNFDQLVLVLQHYWQTSFFHNIFKNLILFFPRAAVFLFEESDMSSKSQPIKRDKKIFKF